MSSNTAITVSAPASAANVGVGFDLLGLAFDDLRDRITIFETTGTGIEITCNSDELPENPVDNTATAGVIELLEDFDIPAGVRINIDKGIPLEAGLGGSAASAVAGVYGIDKLFELNLSETDLLNYALIGEEVASRGIHGDNVAPALFGGIQLFTYLDDIPRSTRIPVPEGLKIILVHPQMKIPTAQARDAMPSKIEISTHLDQSMALSGFLTSCYRDDIDMIGKYFRDFISEPSRSRLIPGFDQIKKEADNAGAIGTTISGAGPTILALARDNSEAIANAIQSVFEQHGLRSTSWIGPVSTQGARIEED